MFPVLLLTFFTFFVLRNGQHLMPLPDNLIHKEQGSLQLLTKPIHFKRHHRNSHQYHFVTQLNNTVLLEFNQSTVTRNVKAIRCKGGGCNNFWTHKESVFGPDNWHLYYPACGTGSSNEKQSPIDITFPINDYYVTNPSISNLIFTNTVSEANTLQLKNNGHSLQVGFPPNNGNLLSGGLLSETYSLAFFNFHWGTNDKTGSEHFINGHQFPLEIHFVYWNSQNGNLASSVSTKGETIIIAVLFDIGKKNIEIEDILGDAIPTLIKAKTKTVLSQKLSVQNLFPSTAAAQWISYPGSLTAPPCTETITWIVLKDTMTIHPDQIAKLRKLTSDLRGKTPIGANYRQIQLRNNRPLVTSFEPVGKAEGGDNDFMLTLTRTPGCWSQARNECQLQGGDLASILSQEEQDGVLTTCKHADGSNYCWIGLTRNIETIGTRDGWYWVDGTDESDYQAWCCREGIGRNDSQSYGVIEDDNPNGEWHDEINCPKGGFFGVCMIPIDLDKEAKVKEIKQIKAIKQVKEVKKVKEIKEIKEVKEIKKVKEVKEIKKVQKDTEDKDNEYKWGYDGQNGPAFWHKQYPECLNSRQSPIDITFGSTDFYTLDKSKPKLIFSDSVDQPGSIMLQNNGYSLQANYRESICSHRLAGGSLLGTYNLAKIQFHWGINDKTGSEHFMNGRQYPLEIQFVYWNIKNKDFVSSITSEDEDGLAIVSVLFSIGEENTELQEFLKYTIPKLVAANTKTFNPQKFSINNLRPPTAATQWISYEGSLTTPPCSQSVTWIISKDIMTVSSDQLAELRKLTSDSSGVTQIHQNSRPLQALNDRELTASFVVASTPIDIPNWSFSKPGIALRPPANWYCGPGPCAVFENDGLHGNKINGAGDPYMLFLNSRTEIILTQTIPTKYSANHAYALTVALAGRADNPGLPSNEVSLAISLCYLNSDTCIGSMQVTYDQLSNFVLQDFTYTTPVLDDFNPATGNQIVIAINTVVFGNSGGDWTVDNIRLQQLAPAQLARSRRILTLTPQATCWPKARANCQAMGGDLVSIATEAEQRNVLSKCKDADRANSCWTGFVREKETLGKRLGWEWTDNTQSAFSNWCCDEGQGRGDGENYGIIEDHPLGDWHDAHACEFKRFGVCAIPRDFVFTLTKAKYSWSGALQDCQSQGGSLASIASEEEQSRVITKCRETKIGSDCWLGFSRNVTEVKTGTRTGWSWNDGTEYRGFHKWAISEGYALEDERDYAVVNIKNRFGQWHNYKENEKKLYGVCILPRVLEASPSYYIPCPESQPPTPLPTTRSPTLSPTTRSPTLSPTTKSPTLSPTTQSPTLSPTTQSPTISPTTVSPTLAPTPAPTGCLAIEGYTTFPNALHPSGEVTEFSSLLSCAINCKIKCIGFHWVQATVTSSKYGVCYHWGTKMTLASSSHSSCLYIKDEETTEAPIAMPTQPPTQLPTPSPIYILKDSDLMLTLTKQASNWFDARKDCQWQGGDLASITSQEEQNAVLSKCQHTIGESQCWIGLRREEGKTGRNGWFWVDGTQDFGYQSWCCEEGLGLGGGQDFAIIEDDNILGEWYDVVGKSKNDFYGVCMIPHKDKYDLNFDIGYEDLGDYEDYGNPFSLLGNQESANYKKKGLNRK